MTDEETRETTITVTGGECPGTVAEGHFLYHVGQKTGGCDNLAGASGSADGTKGNTVSVSYRGLEDLWGNVFELVDGVNIKNRAADDIDRIEAQPYVADHGFESNKFTEPYKASGISLPLGNGYVKDFIYAADADWLLMPAVAGGTGAGSGTYIPDNYYSNFTEDTINRVALVGGSWASGGSAGLFYFDTSFTFSNAGLNVGTRLLQIPE